MRRVPVAPDRPGRDGRDENAQDQLRPHGVHVFGEAQRPAGDGPDARLLRGELKADALRDGDADVAGLGQVGGLSAHERSLLARNQATVLDLSLSRDYRRAHIPGAWWAIRSRRCAMPRAPSRHETVL